MKYFRQHINFINHRKEEDKKQKTKKIMNFLVKINSINNLILIFTVIMLKLSNMYTGTIGDRVYKIVKGQQIVVSAPSRVNQPNTEAQMQHRCKWPNVVGMYRAYKPYAKHCFEYKAKTASDYGRFVSVNVTYSDVYLTKEMANQKAAIVAPYLVSQGSLDTITVSGTGSSAKSDISLGALNIGSATTVAQFAEAVVANNERI